MSFSRFNPWFGINAAASLTQLQGLRRNARLQESINLRTAARVLGVPARELEEEMLAGGDITINRGSGAWPWILLAVILAALGAAGLYWAQASRSIQVQPAPIKQGSYGLGLDDLKVF